MLEVTRDQLVSTFQEHGLTTGDGVILHSALQFLGKPTGGVEIYLDALQSILGPQGTIAVPTFNFSFARGERYDPDQTPSVGMGAFAEYVRQRPEARRTHHPMQSVAVIGFHADDLAERDTLSAFDSGSAFERLLELNFKVLLAGTGMRAVALVHYAEQRARVPYRYWKTFQGEVRQSSGWVERTYHMYVRDLEIGARLHLAPIQDLLEARGQWRQTHLNYGEVIGFRARDFVTAAQDLLSEDRWALIENREEALARVHGLEAA